VVKLSNAMELAVRTHLNLLRTQAPAAGAGCWCPLCRADTMALALSSLPPRYATRRAVHAALEQPVPARILDDVVHARARVGRYPKHAPGAAVAPDEPVWVVNFPLEEGLRAVGAIIRRGDGPCDCWNCRCDTVAIALNRYPAHYGVEYRGRTDLLERDRARMRTELAVLLECAARLVGTVPRHDAHPAA
jgi:hypothetical protein